MNANFGNFNFLVKAVMKFRVLQISKIFNTDTNRIFPIPFKLMYISLRYGAILIIRNAGLGEGGGLPIALLCVTE